MGKATSAILAAVMAIWIGGALLTSTSRALSPLDRTDLSGYRTDLSGYRADLSGYRSEPGRLGDDEADNQQRGWLEEESGESINADEAHGVVDLSGNEVSAAVARYKFDSAGSLYEVHSPRTELPRLGVPKS